MGMTYALALILPIVTTFSWLWRYDDLVTCRFWLP
jgi:hypothetical protein